MIKCTDLICTVPWVFTHTYTQIITTHIKIHSFSSPRSLPLALSQWISLPQVITVLTSIPINQFWLFLNSFKWNCISRILFCLPSLLITASERFIHVIVCSSSLFFFLLEYVVVVQLLSHVWLFATPWTAVCPVSLSFTICQWCYLIILSSATPFSFSV